MDALTYDKPESGRILPKFFSNEIADIESDQGDYILTHKPTGFQFALKLYTDHELTVYALTPCCSSLSSHRGETCICEECGAELKRTMDAQTSDGLQDAFEEWLGVESALNPLEAAVAASELSSIVADFSTAVQLLLKVAMNDPKLKIIERKVYHSDGSIEEVEIDVIPQQEFDADNPFRDHTISYLLRMESHS